MSPRTPTAPLELSGDKWQEMLEKHADHHHQGNAHFLKWHSAFIVDFHTLLSDLQKHNKPAPAKSAIAPWGAIPQELKEAEFVATRLIDGRTESFIARWRSEWDATEHRLENRIESFKSLDDLASAIIRPHDFLHGAVAKEYFDPNIGDRRTAPWSPHFWRLHGLIERWYRDWLDFQAMT